MNTLTPARAQQEAFARLTRQAWPAGVRAEIWCVDMDSDVRCQWNVCYERGYCLSGYRAFCVTHAIDWIIGLADFAEPWSVEIDVARPANCA